MRTFLRVAQPSASHQEEEIGIGEGLEEVCASDYRKWDETNKAEERICKEKSVSELRVRVEYYTHYYANYVSLHHTFLPELSGNSNVNKFLLFLHCVTS